MSRVEKTLDLLGLEYEETGGEYRANCPGHKRLTGHEDSNPSWYINAESGLHICFSCGFKGNLASLVAEVRGLDMAQAQAMLVDNRAETDYSSIRHRLLKATTWHKPLVRAEYLPESSLARFAEPPGWARVVRRVSAEACRHYQVMWDDSNGAWILPIRDADSGRLLGWQVKSQVNRWYVRNRPAGVKKSAGLFGLNTFESGDTTVWVVESPLDAVRLHSAGLPAVSTFGAKVSKRQIELLSAFDRIVLAFDNDDAGAIATDEFLATGRKMGLDVLVAMLPSDRKDPGDCTDEELDNLSLVSVVRL